MSQFLSDLRLDLIEDEGEDGRAHWRLGAPLKYYSSVHWRGRHIGLIVVPRGFETDLASVPRLPVAWMLAGGIANRPSVIHDWLCDSRRFTSRIAAAVFAEACAAEGIVFWRRAIMWAAVRCCGPRW